MPSKKTPSRTNRATVDLLIDLVAGACILVIAGRPEALAITVSAVIIATFVVIYRAASGAKAFLSDAGRGRVATTDDVPPVRPAPPVATNSAAERTDRSAWLRG